MINNMGKVLEANGSTNSSTSGMGLQNLLKIPNNWRNIVEEMGESEDRLKKVMEVGEVMERWLKAKIKISKGLFSFDEENFEARKIKEPAPIIPTMAQIIHQPPSVPGI
jgi:hypothetical protein